MWFDLFENSSNMRHHKMSGQKNSLHISTQGRLCSTRQPTQHPSWKQHLGPLCIGGCALPWAWSVSPHHSTMPPGRFTPRPLPQEAAGRLVWAARHTLLPTGASSLTHFSWPVSLLYYWTYCMCVTPMLMRLRVSAASSVCHLRYLQGCYFYLAFLGTL